MKELEKVNKKINFGKIKNIIRIILFLLSLILTYFASEYIVNYVSTLSLELVKRVLNIVLVLIITIIYAKSK